VRSDKGRSRAMSRANQLERCRTGALGAASTSIGGSSEAAFFAGACDAAFIFAWMPDATVELPRLHESTYELCCVGAYTIRYENRGEIM
jgi:hypothetical protein